MKSIKEKIKNEVQRYETTTQRKNAINSLALMFLERLCVVPNFYADQIIKAVQAGAEWSDEHPLFSEKDYEAGANYVLDVIGNILSHPTSYVNADKSIEEGMIDDIIDVIEQLKN